MTPVPVKTAEHVLNSVVKTAITATVLSRSLAQDVRSSSPYVSITLYVYACLELIIHSRIKIQEAKQGEGGIELIRLQNRRIFAS